MADLEKRIRGLAAVTDTVDNSIRNIDNNKTRFSKLHMALASFPFILFLVLYFWNPECNKVEDPETGEYKRSYKRLAGITLLMTALVVGGYFGYTRYYNKDF